MLVPILSLVLHMYCDLLQYISLEVLWCKSSYCAWPNWLGSFPSHHFRTPPNHPSPSFCCFCPSWVYIKFTFNTPVTCTCTCVHTPVLVKQLRYKICLLLAFFQLCFCISDKAISYLLSFLFALFKHLSSHVKNDTSLLSPLIIIVIIICILHCV